MSPIKKKPTTKAARLIELLENSGVSENESEEIAQLVCHLLDVNYNKITIDIN